MWHSAKWLPLRILAGWASPPSSIECHAMLVLLIAFTLSFGITLWIVHGAKAGSRRFHDLDLSGPQKFHAAPVPRVGGIGIFAGSAAGLLVLWLRQPAIGSSALLLMLCALPAFGAGLSLDDLTSQNLPAGL